MYEELFERHPEIIPLIDGTDQKQQQLELLQFLQMVVNNLRKPEQLTEALAEPGNPHRGYGALEGHYSAVA